MNVYEMGKRLEYLEKAADSGQINTSLLVTYVKSLRAEVEKLKTSEHVKDKYLLLFRLEELLQRLR